MGISDENLRGLVNSVVSDYYNSSRSRKLANVRPDNQDALFEMLKSNKFALNTFVADSIKRDKITFKLNKLLDDLIRSDKDIPEGQSVDRSRPTSRDSSRTPSAASSRVGSISNSSSSHTSSIPSSTSSQGPRVRIEPKIINNFHTAKKYLESSVFPDSNKMKLIYKLYEDQKKLEVVSFQERKKIIADAQIRNKKGSRVLELVKRRNDEQRVSQQLAAFDEKFHAKMEHFYNKCLSTLHDLQIPFFCLIEDLQYPTIREEQDEIISYIIDFCMQPKNLIGSDVGVSPSMGQLPDHREYGGADDRGTLESDGFSDRYENVA